MKLLLLCFLLTSSVSTITSQFQSSNGGGGPPNKVEQSVIATTKDMDSYAEEKGKIIQNHYQKAKDGPKKRKCHDESSDKMDALNLSVPKRINPCLSHPIQIGPGPSSPDLVALKQCLGTAAKDYKKALDKIEADVVSCLKGL